MKAILVIDVDTTQDSKHICKNDKQSCPLWNKDMNFCMYNFNNNTKGCPLKPMPQKKNPLDDCGMWNGKGIQGWNACIDKIIGEEK